MAGATVYSVEGAVWGVVTLGWITSRLTMAGSVLDQAVGISMAVGSILNLLGCTLAVDSDQVQFAFFTLSLPLWIVYAYFIAETMSSPSVETLLFGSMIFPLVSSALSMAFLTVQVLLSAAALGPNLWKKSTWADASVIFLTGFQAALCWDAADGLGISCAILAADLLCLASLWVRLLELRQGQVFLKIFTGSNIEIVHAAFVCVAGVLAVGLAAMAKTTTWVLPILMASLLLGIVLRTVYWKPASEEAREGHASAVLGFPGEHPAAPAPAPAPVAVTMAPTNAARFCLEPIYNFQNQAKAAGKSKGL